ncbi:MAG: hypothetical protein Q8Q36_00550 [bacterium]|nr:hypothetical protein [bacterium]
MDADFECFDDASLRLSVELYDKRLPWSYLCRWRGLLERANVPLLGRAVFPGGKKVALRWRSEHEAPQWYLLEPEEDLEAIWPDEASILFVGRTKEAMQWFPSAKGQLHWAGECLIFQLQGMSFRNEDDPVLAIPLLVIPAEGGRLHRPKTYVHPHLLGKEIKEPPLEELKRLKDPRWELFSQIHWRESIERAVV